MCSYTCFGDYSCVSNSNIDQNFNNTEHFYGSNVYAKSLPHICGNNNTDYYVMKNDKCYYIGPLTNNMVNNSYYRTIPDNNGNCPPDLKNINGTCFRSDYTLNKCNSGDRMYYDRCYHCDSGTITFTNNSNNPYKCST